MFHVSRQLLYLYIVCCSCIVVLDQPSFDLGDVMWVTYNARGIKTTETFVFRQKHIFNKNEDKSMLNIVTHLFPYYILEISKGKR